MKKGWKILSFGELARVFNGNSISEAEKKAQFEGIDDGVPYIGTKDVSFDYEVAYESGVKIPDDRRDNFKLAPANTVLVCAEGGSAGRKIAHTDRDIYFGNKLFAICPTPLISSRLIFYYCLSDDFTKQFKGSMAGLIGGVSINKFKELSVPVPPLAEQQRIVGLLDEAFEGLATAKANAEKNLQNARALFESHLQSVFTQRGPGWVDRTLDQVCIVERGSSPRPIKEYFTTEPDGVNWIKIGDTEEGGKYVYSTGQKITPEGAKHSRLVKEGDFILTNSMSYGRPYIMKTSGYIHDGWFVLRLNMAIDTDYFYYLLASPVVQLQFAALASGSVVKNISGDLVKKAILPIPPLEHQHIIVEKLMALEEETQRLARLYERKHAALAALKKSLLHQAFNGEL